MTTKVNIKALRRAREELELQQVEMAELLGVHKSTYCKYESGDLFPGPRVMQKVAELLGEEKAAEIFFKTR